MSALSEVVTFPIDNAGNIAAMLRQAADTIAAETDADNRTRAIIAVQLHEDGTAQVYGWGKVDNLQAIGVLHMGATKLATDALT